MIIDVNLLIDALVAVNNYGYDKALHLKRRDWPEFRRAYTNYQAALDALAEIDKETP